MKLVRLAAFALLTVSLVGGCSDTNPKKKPLGGDASTGDGSTAAGGSGGFGGADAAPDVTDAAPDVADAAPDVTDAAVCGQGTVNLIAGGCLACPADGGVADSGAAGAGGAAGTGGMTGEAGVDGGGPYRPILSCQMLASGKTRFDPATGILTVELGYPLQIDSVDYEIKLTVQSVAGSTTNLTIKGSASPTGNVMTVDLSGQIGAQTNLVAVDVMNLTARDACGRTSIYDNADCPDDPGDLTFSPGDGGAWAPICGPTQC